MSDYQEMILMQNPYLTDPFPRNPTPEEIAALVQRPSPRNPSDRSLLEKFELIQEGLQNNLRAKEARSITRRAAADVTADASALAAVLASPTFPERSAGYVSDSHSARTTRSDTLWPGGSAIFEDATGDNPPPPAYPLPRIGIWDEGGVLPSANPGLAGRLFQGNTTSELISEFKLLNAEHTVMVAEIIALEDQNPNTPSEHQDLQGLAWKANLEIYSEVKDYREMAAAAVHDPSTSKIGMTFSNHSYSPGAGWEYAASQGGPVWWGPLNLAPELEDPEFGSYTTDSRTIDSTIYHAQTYLPVFTAGNSANNGEPVPPNPVGPNHPYTAVRLIQDPNDPYLYTRELLFNQTARHAGTAGEPVAGAPDPEDVHDVLEMDLQIGSGIGLGLDTVKSTGVAKNNLTVGAIYTGQDGTDATPATIGLSHFSSRGPIDDGRVKPDLMAPSTFETLSPFSTDRGATSWAAPAVTGILALLQEINADGGGQRLLASTWKALLLNTALDCTDLTYLLEKLKPGSFTEFDLVRVPSHLGAAADAADLVGPDYFYGWGLADAFAAAELLVNNLRSESGAAHLCEHTLHDPSNDADDSNNITVEIPFEWDGTTPQLRAMLCWTDPPYQNTSPSTLFEGNFDPETGLADDPAIPRNLVNDLDLWIVDPDGKSHRPWVLDPENPLTPATRVTALLEDENTVLATNDLDNVEQVVIDAPVPGTYILKVTHKGRLTTTENVSGTGQFAQITGREQHFSSRSREISTRIRPARHLNL